ncbi:C-5 sterol desaturase [Pandoraea anapnoica]|uniref:C-5 sterol desaturase n=1 Tax=Pandoraea anapnoica TaxID=2508301 RepID=A0A5E5AQ38_9BURK|nr:MULTISPECIES: sterol desaturase family protein [Pandoraea]VVE59162.1 C-5 sterol desaturase [Pandoraea iniqua]VVE75921.1 C-5 sterol desaturase [Pandoraea anapnoica]
MNAKNSSSDKANCGKVTLRYFAYRVFSSASKLTKANGPLKVGQGLIATIFALVLASLSLLGVIAFHYPQYLTTPELRHVYSVGTLRHMLFGALLAAGGLALTSCVLGNRRRLNGLAFVIVLASIALGGANVPVGDFPDHTPYVGLDWFILDLLGSTTIFVMIEKAFPLNRSQAVFRFEWQTDMVHFSVNHLVVGLVLLVVNLLVHGVFGWLASAKLQLLVRHLWFIPQLLLCMLVADMMEYLVHRAYHEVPILWRFHAVHHSVRSMDWLAGSRQHILEVVATRVAVLGPLFVIGFSKSVVDVYIIIVGFQAVFNHTNVRLPWGPLKYVFVTPDFHHWHHSSEDEAIDKNYAAHFAFIDRIFGTAVKSKAAFPRKYGVVGDYVPDGFLAQQAFPFFGSKRSQ